MHADLPIWRSILFVPATSARFIESAVRQAADALQIDLEDSVSPQEKDVARAAVAPIARSFVQAGKAVIVRVNRPWRLLVRDLEASVCEAVSAISLPKVPDAGFIKSVAEVLSELEFERGLVQGHTRLIAMIEDPEGVHHVDAIAQAHARMLGLNAYGSQRGHALHAQHHGAHCCSACRVDATWFHRQRGGLQGSGGFSQTHRASPIAWL
ncbi:MAG: hypothetical protein EBT32_11010 [Betaproteobacteria bacterium]|nr:hypothetical protein [Betaproteobacteria bacterium]